jgi:putative tricarboxylic transport membrane protein
MRLGRDGIAGLIGLAVSLALLPMAWGLPKLPIVPVGPGFYPIIVLVFMALCSGALLVQDLLARRAAASSEGARGADGAPAYGLVVAAFAVVVGYVALLPVLGFRVATVLFVAAFLIALDRPTTPRQWATLLAVAVGTALVGHLVFERYLLVLLPRGTWTGF